jgi:hypothetical protein
MNICDNDDDDIMEFLIHDEDDDFTKALITIVSNILEEESDDDEPLVPPYVWGSGSRVGKASNIERRRVFYSHLTYFKKFLKIPIGLFDDIVSKVTANDDYFRQKTDAAGKMGLSSLQKICSAVHLESVLQNTKTSIAWRPRLVWKP